MKQHLFLMQEEMGGQDMPNDNRRPPEQNNRLHRNCFVFDASRRHSYPPFGDICCTVESFWGTGG